MVNKSGQRKKMVCSPAAFSKACLVCFDNFKFIYNFPKSIIKYAHLSMPRILPSMSK